MRTQVGIFLFAAALAACNSNQDTRGKNRPPVAADNTGRNAHDPGVTADNAVETRADLDITQEIRKAIVDDSSLSTNGHNVKIVVRDGVVTLRGPVESTAERAAIEQIAMAAGGPHEIINELEITN